AQVYYPEYIYDVVDKGSNIEKDMDDIGSETTSISSMSSMNTFNVPSTLDFASEIPGLLFVSILFPYNFCYERTIEHQNPDYTLVQIEDGIALPSSGPLCKMSVGGKNNAIIHMLWKRAPEFSLKFLSE